jgi:hypothetical protein
LAIIRAKPRPVRNKPEECIFNLRYEERMKNDSSYIRNPNRTCV